MAMRERLKDNPQQMQQEMMKLYREEKVNPIGGCLPILVQVPVFIALYWVLLSSVEMRHAPWIGWIQDLSAKDPFYILPVVMTLTTMLQTALNPVPPDPLQAKLMWFMPLIFSVMFFVFPAGLVLYWITNNVLSIAQQWLINTRMGVPPEFNIPKFKYKNNRAASRPFPLDLRPPSPLRPHRHARLAPRPDSRHRHRARTWRRGHRAHLGRAVAAAGAGAVRPQLARTRGDLPALSRRRSLRH
jgi:YidC/Oxa1 family membrane protein insertase